MAHIRIKVARTFVPHVMLLNGAAKALEAANGKTEGQWWDWLTATLLCSLSVEAIGNTYGETFVKNWQHFESASPIAKIRVVAERCGIQPDFSRHPWSAINDLIRFRNRIAHAKMETITVEGVYPKDDYEREFYKKPQSKLERCVTEKFAQQSRDAIYDILAEFAKGLPIKQLIPLETDEWQGSASTEPNPGE